MYDAAVLQEEYKTTIAAMKSRHLSEVNELELEKVAIQCSWQKEVSELNAQLEVMIVHPIRS